MNFSQIYPKELTIFLCRDSEFADIKSSLSNSTVCWRHPEVNGLCVLSLRTMNMDEGQSKDSQRYHQNERFPGWLWDSSFLLEVPAVLWALGTLPLTSPLASSLIKGAFSYLP
ncbi:uncharacterized protein LOC144220175 [Crocuta crocuta]